MPVTPASAKYRVAKASARRWSAAGRLGFDAITARVGYEDSNSFRRLFCQRVGLSPAVFRKRFLRPPAAQPEPSR